MKPADIPPAVYRLGRRPDPWAWPDWRYAATDGTFGNRFDGLAYFRPDPAIVAEYDAIVGGDEDEQEPPSGGEVPAEWVEARCIGTGTLTGAYVELGHHETLAELRRLLAARLVHHGIGDLDAAAIRLTAPRAFTQEISRHVFDDSVGGARRWNGIAYLSKHGDDLDNWAIFEPAAPAPHRRRPLRPSRRRPRQRAAVARAAHDSHSIRGLMTSPLASRGPPPNFRPLRSERPDARDDTCESGIGTIRRPGVRRAAYPQNSAGSDRAR